MAFKTPKSTELLDIGFGGKFSSEIEYTNPSGEIKDGDFIRRTGKESIKDSNVYLNGAQDGVDFVPRISLGSNELDTPFILEASFNPDGAPKKYDTLLSVGVDLYVRYTSVATIEYGFDVNNNGTWSSEKNDVSVPDVDEEITVAMAYHPVGYGAKMQVFINGIELPSVSSDNSKPAIGNIESVIGFGNGVHSASLNRGFKGFISKAIVTQFNGLFDKSLLKTMKTPKSERRLLMYGLGKIDGLQYNVAQDENAEGYVEINGGVITESGKIRMNGNSSNMIFFPSKTQLDKDFLTGYIAEIVFNPTDLECENILIDIACAVTVRWSGNNSVEILVKGKVKSTIKLSGKLTKEIVHLSLVYQLVDENNINISLWLCQEKIGENIILSSHPETDGDSVVFVGTDNKSPGSSLKGEIYGIAFTSLKGDFSKELLGLYEGICIVPDNLEPSHEINIKLNECPLVLMEKASQVRPKPKQIRWQQYEQTAFIHYGINTYYEVEWGGFNLNPNNFQPTDLDTNQWAKTLKESGFKLAMLTVKHHDGFMLYPSRYTEFSVVSSSWKNGTGDVLREFVDSMRKYGLKVGIYLSPADHKAYSDGIFANGSSRKERKIPTLVEGDNRKVDSSFPTFTLPGTDYGEYFMNTLYEVLTEYGQIDEVWFDGAQGRIPGDVEEKYDWDSYYNLINNLQPKAIIANTGEDVRWVGNESGFARDNEWSVVAVSKTENRRQYSYPSSQSSNLGSKSVISEAARNGMNYLTWWPAEVDVSIRDGWFYHDEQQPKSVDELRKIYYDSIARNAVLLLNIPPNKEGKFAERDVERLKEWYQSIEKDFAVNHVKDANIISENDEDGSNAENVRDDNYDTSWQTNPKKMSSITFSFIDTVAVDRVILQENINKGQQVESFAIEVLDDNNKWKVFYFNEAIGYKRIVTLKERVIGRGFRVRILRSRSTVHLSKIGLYQTFDNNATTASNVFNLE